METIVRWLVPPHMKNIRVVNAGIDAFCSTRGISSQDALRIQACVEGVLGYCVGNIRTGGKSDEISILLQYNKVNVKITMEHTGPGGEWDAQLRADSAEAVRRTSFDAMGLFIAREMLSSLIHECRLDIVSGRNVRSYVLLYHPGG